MIFFVGILHFASCPNLKMDTKETLSASAFGGVEPFSLLTYFDWLTVEIEPNGGPISQWSRDIPITTKISVQP